MNVPLGQSDEAAANAQAPTSPTKEWPDPRFPEACYCPPVFSAGRLYQRRYRGGVGASAARTSRNFCAIRRTPLPSMMPSVVRRSQYRVDVHEAHRAGPPARASAFCRRGVQLREHRAIGTGGLNDHRGLRRNGRDEIHAWDGLFAVVRPMRHGVLPIWSAFSFVNAAVSLVPIMSRMTLLRRLVPRR
jgi:hypothetical protein